MAERQDRKQIGANSLARNLFRLVACGDVEGTRFKRRDANEDSMLLLPVEEIFTGNNILQPPAMRILFPQHNEFVRFGIWQGPEKDRIHYPENRHIRPDTERASVSTATAVNPPLLRNS